MWKQSKFTSNPEFSFLVQFFDAFTDKKQAKQCAAWEHYGGHDAYTTMGDRKVMLGKVRITNLLLEIKTKT